VALGLEHHHLVDPPELEPKVDLDVGRAEAGDTIKAVVGLGAGESGPVVPQDHLAGGRPVHPAEVHRQPAVDEDPDVVVAGELEAIRLAGVVLEPVADLAREAEVVLAVLAGDGGLGRPVARGLVELVIRRGDAGGGQLGGGREGVAVDREEERIAVGFFDEVGALVGVPVAVAAQERVAELFHLLAVGELGAAAVEPGLVLMAEGAGQRVAAAVDGAQFLADRAAPVGDGGDLPALAVRPVAIDVPALAVVPQGELAAGGMVDVLGVAVPLREGRLAGDVHARAG